MVRLAFQSDNLPIILKQIGRKVRLEIGRRDKANATTEERGGGDFRRSRSFPGKKMAE